MAVAIVAIVTIFALFLVWWLSGERHPKRACPACCYEGRPIRAQRRVGKGTVLVCPACRMDPRDGALLRLVVFDAAPAPRLR